MGTARAAALPRESSARAGVMSPGVTLGGKIDDPTFHQFLAARAYYVMARVAILTPAYAGPDVLLAQQALELYIKAIRRQCGDEPGNDHNLIELMKHARMPRPPYFDAVLGDSSKRDFLSALTEGYAPVRYRERAYSLNLPEMSAQLDELVFNFDRTFRELQPAANRRLIVSKAPLQWFVLAGNRFFREDDVTDNLRAVTSDIESPSSHEEAL
jgi:HEPN domain-containing protein